MASAHAEAEEALAKNTTTEMQASAITLLSTRAAGTVKAAMPSIASTIGIFRPATGEELRRVSLSENQPAARHPMKPQKKGSAVAKPEVTRFMPRACVRDSRAAT